MFVLLGIYVVLYCMTVVALLSHKPWNIAVSTHLVMCDNDFTTLSIIMMILSQYDNYHDSTTNGKITEPLFLMPTILHPN